MKKLLIIVFISFISLMQGEELSKTELKYIDINNIQVPIIFENSSLLPIGFVSIVFNGGGSINQNKNSISTFASDMLNRGTKTKGESAFALDLESNAISLTSSATLEVLKFDLEFLKEKENIALNLLGELLNDPNISKDAFEKTKLNLNSYLLTKQNDFDYIASRNLNKIFFKGTPLERVDSVDSINAITLNDVTNYIKSTLVLNNLVIIAGGDMDFNSISSKLKKILSPLPNGEKYVAKKYSPSSNPETTISKNDTKQAYIYFAAPFAFESYENDLHKSQVMSFIMGSSGFGSRILEEVRVKRGLAYSAYFYNVINNVTSYASGYLQTKLSNKDSAIQVVKQTISDFISSGATKEELENAKAYILGSEPLKVETLNQRLNRKYLAFQRGLPLNYDEVILQKIKNLSLEELNSYIKSHKEILNLSISIVQDK